MGKRDPSTRRRVETTLCFASFVSAVFSLFQGLYRVQWSSPFVILLSHETLERRETSIHDKFQITKLPLSQSNISELL